MSSHYLDRKGTRQPIDDDFRKAMQRAYEQFARNGNESNNVDCFVFSSDEFEYCNTIKVVECWASVCATLKRSEACSM
jgi:hypothetical protein